MDTEVVQLALASVFRPFHWVYTDADEDWNDSHDHDL